ncbi:MAG TPA: acetoacetate--CoA ligase [Alphaproteobacteria bacterium]|nr:acetoacetate--CoA ligase [Alphaproteobacteria bacterium]
MSEPLWRPSPERVAASRLTEFTSFAAQRTGRRFLDFDALWRWSVEDIAAFWDAVWDFCGVVAETKGARVLADGERMPGARFFPEARLNFAENLLQTRGAGEAILFRGEDKVRRRLSWDDLHAEVSRLQQALSAAGVKPGDRVAAFVANMPEAVIAMLATSSLGAIWSSCSPDFGAQGVIDRFGQIEPKLLFFVEGYFYNGKTIDCLPRLPDILKQVPSIERAVVIAYARERPDIAAIGKAVSWPDFLAPHSPKPVSFARLPFDHPLCILYSSGTTGVPKCIVHGAGGTLLQHLKEHRLHTDIKAADRVFYFTTCGWMMWNWLVSALASGATLALYDGSPFHPSGMTLFDYAQEEGISFFGTSAKFIDACGKGGVAPKAKHSLTKLRTIASTGSPLLPEGFDYVYSQVKREVCLSSISGGTDIISCFVLGNPNGPVWRGEIQAPGLGMKVEVFDEGGRPLEGEKGELVCTRPFPSMPVGFWNDPDGAKYRAAYFERYPGVWRHGDWIGKTPHGGFVIYGRSDAVLNPGGVRIGTAEIYRQVEQLEEVEESIVIGQDWQGDVRVVLFVKLRAGLALDAALEKTIKDRIRANTTPRHVPAKILQVPDIPRTKSGKIVELAVRDVVHGRAVKNKEALANPEALAHYADRPELRA